MQNLSMANTYLTVDFKEKNDVKALGARWDGLQRQWYVPEGRELGPFTQWLPRHTGIATPSESKQLSMPGSASVELSMPAKKGVSLSSLLAGVSQAVANAYRTGVWVLVEVVELRMNGGHVFMGVSERDGNGTVLAKTSAVIWQSMASSVLPEFERTTGAQLAPGIKLLVRARPIFKPIHGFTIEVDAIDPEYTLGDLEARKRVIRERLQAEGVFAANKKLPAPWDFNAVLVVAPAGGAGLGDFQAEADRLEAFGLCRFVYAFSRFQGEGAAKEICDVLQSAWGQWLLQHDTLPEAVVIIRGGGAVNDLAWLNDYDLARFICDLSVPVLTGIGHERDSTVLDEVANCKYDTPSKVIAGIEQTIAKRTAEAKVFFEQVTQRATHTAHAVNARLLALDAQVRADAVRHIAQGKQEAADLINEIKLGAVQDVRMASDLASEAFQLVKADVLYQVQQARQRVPALWQSVSMQATRNLQIASMNTDQLLGAVVDQARHGVSVIASRTDEALLSVSASAKQLVRSAGVNSEALMREIAGQGPEKTLHRGFAMVREPSGKTVTRASNMERGAAIEIQFSDGKVAATAGKII